MKNSKLLCGGLFSLILAFSSGASASTETFSKLKQNASSIVSSNSIDKVAQKISPTDEEVDNVESENIEEDIFDTLPPTLPEGLEIEQDGGNFSLGIIRPIPVLSLEGQVSVTNHRVQDNSFSTSQNSENTAIVNSAALRISPELGRRNRVEGGVRLSHAILNNENLNYNVFDADLGVRREIDRNTALLFGWRYQKLSDRFDDFSDHEVRLKVDRIDRLGERFFIGSNYEGRVSFADASAQNRWSNEASANFSYIITPKLLGQVGYRFRYTDYFESDSVINHQIGTQMTYFLDEQISITGSVIYQVGEYVDRLTSFPFSEDVNNLSFGLHLGFDIPIAY